MSFDSQSRLQLDARDLGPENLAVMALRTCLATEDGSRHEDGIIEFTFIGGSARVRSTGLYSGEQLTAEPHAAHEGVWVVDLGNVALSADWLSLESEFELLIEVAGAKD